MRRAPYSRQFCRKKEGVTILDKSNPADYKSLLVRSELIEQIGQFAPHLVLLLEGPQVDPKPSVLKEKTTNDLIQLLELGWLPSEVATIWSVDRAQLSHWIAADPQRALQTKLARRTQAEIWDRVNNGDTEVINGQVELAPNAPFINSVEGITKLIQSGATNYAVAGGSGNIISVSLSPALTSYQDGIGLTFKAAATNTAASFISVNGLSNLPILQGGVVLSGGEILADWSYGGFFLSGSFHLMESGAGPVNVGDGTAPTHAVNMSQFPVRPYYVVAQSGTISAPANSTTYTIESLTIVFAAASKSGAFRANVRLVGEGTATAADVRQNFQNVLNDGTNSYIGNASLVAALAVGDTWGTSDTILTSGTYSPGSTVTFTHEIRTGGGGSDFTIQNSFMEIIVEEA